MPIREFRRAARSASAEQLREHLIQEWRAGDRSTASEPVIVLEDATGSLLHIYVVWSEWAPLDQRERSEIIMEAFDSVRPQDTLRVTVAMGLTPAEAERMGIDYR